MGSSTEAINFTAFITPLFTHQTLKPFGHKVNYISEQ